MQVVQQAPETSKLMNFLSDKIIWDKHTSVIHPPAMFASTSDTYIHKETTVMAPGQVNIIHNVESKVSRITSLVQNKL